MIIKKAPSFEGAFLRKSKGKNKRNREIGSFLFFLAMCLKILILYKRQSIATKYKIGNIVKFVFGETPRYKVVVTKEQPRERKNMPPSEVPEGYNYLIVENSLRPGDQITPFVPVNEQHLELISEN